MLLERDYMKAPGPSKIRIVDLPAPSWFSSFTTTQWVNVLIFVMAALLLGFILFKALL